MLQSTGIFQSFWHWQSEQNYFLRLKTFLITVDGFWKLVKNTTWSEHWWHTHHILVLGLGTRTETRMYVRPVEGWLKKILANSHFEEIPPGHSQSVHIPLPREYWILYRGPGFLLAHSVSSTGVTQEDWERETNCRRERGGRGGWGAQ